MKQYEKNMIQNQLFTEQRVLREIQQIYTKAKSDTEDAISALNSRQDMQNLQSIIYQRKYQEAIMEQLNSALHALESQQYNTVHDFLEDSYNNGYIGMMYSLQQQTGVTLVVLIDQEKVANALTIDSKISTGYYSWEDPLTGRVAEDVQKLKTRIRSNLSRGIASGSSWLDVAVNIANGMNNPFDIAIHDTMRIARTEGHRVNQEAYVDAGDVAKSKGADILKQWDATLDSRTRPEHQEADGQIVEWDDKFLVGGEKLTAPGMDGSAWNVINCRCQLLQRARWALDETELEELKKRAEFYGLDKSDSFEDFKQKYLKLPENADTMGSVVKIVRNYNSDIAKAVGRNYYDELQDALENSINKDVKSLYALCQDDFRVGDSHHKGGAYHQFGRVYWNQDTDGKNDTYRKKFSVFFHETGHNLDYVLTKKTSVGGWYYSTSWENGKFEKTIKDEVAERINALDIKWKQLFKEHKTDEQWLKDNGFLGSYYYDKLLNVQKTTGKTMTEILSGKVPEAKYYIPKYTKNYVYKLVENELKEIENSDQGNWKVHSVSDIFEGATKGKVQAGWGHGKSYWNTREVSLEAFAEMTEANIVGSESLETIQKYLPKSLAVYYEMIKDAAKNLK